MSFHIFKMIYNVYTSNYFDNISLLKIMLSLKINELNKSSRAGVYFFNSLPLKIPVFELNNIFVFHRTKDVNIQSIVKLLQLIYDFLTSDNKVRSSVYIFFVSANRDVSSWPNDQSTLIQSAAEDKRTDSIPMQLWPMQV